MSLRKTLRNVPLVKRLSVRLRGLDLDEEEWFDDHYVDWRSKRIAAILDHYGTDFFHGKTVLEVGCGYGDIGAAIARHGAIVTCSDARADHLAVVRERHPQVQTVVADLDKPWTFPHCDVLIHLGVLYHLKTPEVALRQALGSSTHVILETEVLDSNDPYVSRSVAEAGYDQAFNNIGSRPSPFFVERILTELGRSFTRIDDDRCNTEYHRYDWPITNTGEHRNGLRRFWFVSPAGSA